MFFSNLYKIGRITKTRLKIQEQIIESQVVVLLVEWLLQNYKMKEMRYKSKLSMIEQLTLYLNYHEAPKLVKEFSCSMLRAPHVPTFPTHNIGPLF